MDEQRLGQTGLRFELSEQPIDVVDVLGPLDLRDHDDVERLTGFEHCGGEIVEAPRRVEAVDPGPELRLAEVDGVGHLDQTGPGSFLLIGGHAVFEVAEQDVDGRHDLRDLRAHLVVRRREEVDHPARRKRDLTDGFGSTDGERAEEVSGWAHGPTVDLARDAHQSAGRHIWGPTPDVTADVTAGRVRTSSSTATRPSATRLSTMRASNAPRGSGPAPNAFMTRPRA